MSLAISLPDAVHASRVDNVRSQSVNPDEWNSWIALGSAVVAGSIWLWRHSLGGFIKWMWNGIKAPQRIEDLYKLHREQHDSHLKEIFEAKSVAEFAMATSRIAWSFVERPVLQFDCFGNCVYVNDFILRLLVRQQDEFQGSGWRTLVHSDDMERIERQWDAAVRDKRNFAQTFRLVTSSGDSVKVFDRAEVLHDRNSNVLGWYHLMSLVD